MVHNTPGLGVPLLLPHCDRHRGGFGLRGDLQDTEIGMGEELWVRTKVCWDLCWFSLLMDPLSLSISWCSISNNSAEILSATSWGQTQSFGVLSWLLPMAIVLFPCAWYCPGCFFSCRIVGFVLLRAVHLSLSRRYNYEVISVGFAKFWKLPCLKRSSCCSQCCTD